MRAADPKGLYERARAGEIAQFTGTVSSYEPPPRPDLELRTDLGRAIDGEAASVCATIGLLAAMMSARGTAVRLMLDGASGQPKLFVHAMKLECAELAHSSFYGIDGAKLCAVARIMHP